MAGEQQGQATTSNTIFFIHAPDSLQWAKFLQSKLLSDNYNISSVLHSPHLSPDFFSAASSSPTPHRRLCALIVSPDLLGPSHLEFWTSFVERRGGPAVVILLGVEKEDLVEVLGESACAVVLSHPWVEVIDRERSTVSLALVTLIEMYEAAERSRLQGFAQESFEEEEEEFEEEEEEEEGVDDEEEEDEGEREKRMERLRKYQEEEGGESPYVAPPPPRQQNDIMKVMPAVLYEGMGGREVVVVMRREAETELRMAVQAKGAPLLHLPLQHVASSAYVATIPNDVHGRVAFRVMSGEHTIGAASIYCRSRLDLLQTLLVRELSPVALLCKAAGVTEADTTTTEAETSTKTTDQDSQIEKLDKVLVRRLSLSQLPPGLQGVLNSEDLEGSAEQDPEYNSQSQWPTLLHFAAEFNLVRVCEALLKYPGMIDAACTENAQGLFPCMLAERRGFKSLHSRLVQYVKEMSTRDGQHKRTTDSGVSFPPDPLPPPKPHGSRSSSYINDTVCCAADPPSTLDTEDDVDIMGMMYVSGKKRSFSEGCVRTPYIRPPSEDRIAEEEDGSDTATSAPDLKPKLTRAWSTVHADRLPHATHNPPLPPRPPGYNRRQLSTTGSPQGSSLVTCSTLPREGPAEARQQSSDVTSGMTSWGTESLPGSGRTFKSSQPDFETLIEDDGTVLRLKTKRSRSLQDKISHFFHKIKPRSHRSSSETNLATMSKGHKKTTVYVRASTASTGSDPTSYSSYTTKSGLSAGFWDHDRDSGAVCDEKSAGVQLRSKKKSKLHSSGKRKGTRSSMKRRMSVRVQRARDEDLSETPSLPARSSKNEDSSQDYKF